MSSTDLIDRIVANVLSQLSPLGASSVPAVKSAVAAKPAVSKSESGHASLALTQRVVTAEALADAVHGGSVRVVNKAIVTPAAWDLVRERGLTIERGDIAAVAKPASAGGEKKSAAPPVKKLLIVVRNTHAVDQVWQELQSVWRRELLGCPDDAAKLAISELTRGGTSQVVILAEQSLRAACLANRNDVVKAVPVASGGDVKQARKQLRVNTWCIDPAAMSYFELRNLFKLIAS